MKTIFSFLFFYDKAGKSGLSCVMFLCLFYCCYSSSPSLCLQPLEPLCIALKYMRACCMSKSFMFLNVNFSLSLSLSLPLNVCLYFPASVISLAMWN